MPDAKKDALPSALACVQFLAHSLRGADIPDDDDLFLETRAGGADALGMLISASEKLGFSPEEVQGGVIPEDYSGPVAVEFLEGEWGCILTSDSLASSVIAYWNSSEKSVLEIGIEDFQQRLTGKAVIFRTLINMEPASHSGLLCMSLVARHLGIDLDERRMAHEYAVDDKEPSPDLLMEMADNYGMRCRKTRVSWEKATSLEDVYPVICRKEGGSYFLLSGVD